VGAPVRPNMLNMPESASGYNMLLSIKGSEFVIHRIPEKIVHQYFVHNFNKCGYIFIIFGTQQAEGHIFTLPN